MKLVCFLILTLISSFSFNKEKDIDCAKFRKGTFYYKGEGDTSLFKIERNDTIQKETLVKTGDYITLRISWIAPCEYHLTFLSQHIFLTDSIITAYQGLKLKSKIVRTRNDSCYIESRFDGDLTSNPIRGVVFIPK